jgi:hypothetical protein
MEIFLDSKDKENRALSVFFNRSIYLLRSQGYIVVPLENHILILISKGKYMLLQASISGVHDQFFKELRERSARAFYDLSIGMLHPQFDFTFINGREFVRLFLEKPVIRNSLQILNIYGGEHPKIAVISNEEEAKFIEKGRKLESFL